MAGVLDVGELESGEVHHPGLNLPRYGRWVVVVRPGPLRPPPHIDVKEARLETDPHDVPQHVNDFVRLGDDGHAGEIVPGDDLEAELVWGGCELTAEEDEAEL